MSNEARLDIIGCRHASGQENSSNSSWFRAIRIDIWWDRRIRHCHSHDIYKTAARGVDRKVKISLQWVEEYWDGFLNPRCIYYHWDPVWFLPAVVFISPFTVYHRISSLGLFWCHNFTDTPYNTKRLPSRDLNLNYGLWIFCKAFIASTDNVVQVIDGQCDKSPNKERNQWQERWCDIPQDRHPWGLLEPMWVNAEHMQQRQMYIPGTYVWICLWEPFT